MAVASEQNIVGVVREYGKRLFGFIRTRVKTEADAEDVLQDVWYQFSRVADSEPIEQLSGWLFKVARNRITDLYRKRSNDSLEDYAYEGEEGETYFKDILLSTPDTPETEYLRQLFWEELLVLFIGVALLMGGAVMWLWNAILPAVLGVGVLTFWQAVGLLALCRILFGGFRSGGGHWKKPGSSFGTPLHLRQGWMQMNDEERARFKEEWRERCRKRDSN